MEMKIKCYLGAKRNKETLVFKFSTTKSFNNGINVPRNLQKLFALVNVHQLPYTTHIHCLLLMTVIKKITISAAEKREKQALPQLALELQSF